MADSLRILRGNKSDMPANLGAGILALCLDTKELYVGDGDGNVKIAMFDEVVPNTGGTILGELELKKADNGYTRIFKNNSATVDYGTRLMDYTADNKKAGIAVSATGQLIDFVKDDGSTSEILHTGNKPTGSYTGNGDATERTISTGGIGRCAYLYGGGYSFIVFSNGAIGKKYDQDDVVTLKESAIRFYNGSFTIKDSSTYINNNGTTYNYQVL